MKRRFNLRVLFLVGLSAALAGALAYRAPGESAVAARLTGLLTGFGLALVTYSGVWLLWQRLAGERRAQEKALELSDERGQLVNVRASAAMGVAATLAVVALTFTATVRGDMLYAALGCAACFAVTATGVVSRLVLGRRL